MFTLSLPPADIQKLLVLILQKVKIVMSHLKHYSARTWFYTCSEDPFFLREGIKIKRTGARQVTVQVFLNTLSSSALFC